ncbi:hypothetical protein RHSIM_Rhsim06G0052000 [Rhododendron simsii]|uniref:DUF4283 domain-containing protein n=1 Tax=Rhododendron simsii TaxID=118357 RepID=A0A834GWJ2_RHOSS|nr:hypothetical protein RHSIM_Rhsim06G0052000 [Rhododendron simsii]
MADEVVARIGNFHLSDEEEDVIIIDEEICQQALVACSFSLVGKLLTTKRFKVAAMKESLRRAWGFPKNLSIVEVGDNLFRFRFEDETSCSRVLNGGPWNFENHLLVVQPWEPGMKADQVLFSSVAFWVQLWGLPFEFVTPAIGDVIGRRIGTLLSVDNREVVGERGRFIRIRVEVPLDKPLKRGGFISLGGGDKIWVDYKFECLNSFCFYCGCLALEMGNCALKTIDEEKRVVKEAKYGPWLKAGGGGNSGGSRFQPDTRRRTGEDQTKSDIFRREVSPAVGLSASKNLNLGKNKEGAILADSGSESRLIEIGDNDRISLNGKDVRVGELLDPRKKRQSVGMEGVIGPIGAGLLTLGDSSSGLNNGGLVNFEVGFDVGPKRTPCVISKESGGHVEVGLESALKEVIVMDSPDNFNLEANDRFSFGALHSKTLRSSSMEPKKRQTRKRGVSSGAGHGKQPGKENSGILGKKRTLKRKDAMDSECEGQKGGCGGEKRLGMGNPLTIQQLKGVCNLYSPDVVFLSETKNKRDFNCILSNDEKWGGLDKEDWELQDFRNFIDDIDLIDVGYVGYPFTWNNKREGRANIRMRLDRVVVNSRWRTYFSSGSLHHLKPGGSDHCPILLKYGLDEDYKVPRFIFDALWAAKEVCGEIVRTSWGTNFVGSRWFCILQKIKLCRKKLRRWRASQRMNSWVKMNELQAQLEQENVKGDFDAVKYRRVEDCMRN